MVEIKNAEDSILPKNSTKLYDSPSEQHELMNGQESVVVNQPETVTDGWETGGRVPAKHRQQLRYYLRCKGLCCPLGGKLSNYCSTNNCNRCWCCFDSCFTFVDDYLIGGPDLKSDDKLEQIEEWFRSYNCWTLPFVTIICVTIEVVYYNKLQSLPDDYTNALLNSPYIWSADTRQDTWRWFTYSFCHGNFAHISMNLILQILLGLYVEFEHKWVRTLFIYVIGVITGSLFHSVVNPCSPLCGSSGGVYALMGACFVKIKRHRKYKGFFRKWCNFLLAVMIFLMAVSDLGYTIYNWATCAEATKSTAISAHLGGIISGVCVSYWMLNKFQESWGQQMLRETGQNTDFSDEEIDCCNYKNCSDAWLNNADCKKLCRDPLGWFLLLLLIGLWIAAIVYNEFYSPANNDVCFTDGTFDPCYQF